MNHLQSITHEPPRHARRSSAQPSSSPKMGIVENEADESGLWIELIGDAGLQKHSSLAKLLQAANELTAITVASIKTARKNYERRSP